VFDVGVLELMVVVALVAALVAGLTALRRR
jgi:hypothetical protein